MEIKFKSAEAQQIFKELKVVGLEEMPTNNICDQLKNLDNETSLSKQKHIASNIRGQIAVNISQQKQAKLKLFNYICTEISDLNISSGLIEVDDILTFIFSDIVDNPKARSARFFEKTEANFIHNVLNFKQYLSTLGLNLVDSNENEVSSQKEGLKKGENFILTINPDGFAQFLSEFEAADLKSSAPLVRSVLRDDLACRSNEILKSYSSSQGEDIETVSFLINVNGYKKLAKEIDRLELNKNIEHTLEPINQSLVSVSHFLDAARNGYLKELADLFSRNLFAKRYNDHPSYMHFSGKLEFDPDEVSFKNHDDLAAIDSDLSAIENANKNKGCKTLAKLAGKIYQDILQARHNSYCKDEKYQSANLLKPSMQRLKNILES